MSIRVFLVDDHPIVVEGLRALLSQTPEFEVVGETTRAKDAVPLIRKLAPDIVTMDVQMRDGSGIEVTRQITSEMPNVKVIALSMHSSRLFVLEMIKAGARGYLLKDDIFGDIVQALKAVDKGEFYVSPKVAGYVLNYVAQSSSGKPMSESLTDRELEIIRLIATGKPTKAIALKIGMSTKTVDADRRTIMRKIGVDNLADLVKYAIREGLTSYDIQP